MEKNERLDLIHSLIAASIAFHETLRQHGYYVSYGLDDTKIGSIKKIGVPRHNNWSLGDLSITWKIRG